MQGPVSEAVLCIREIGDPYVILNSFACGKKSRPLSIMVQRERESLSTCSFGEDRLPKESIQNFHFRILEGIYAEFVSNIIFQKILVCRFYVWMEEKRVVLPIQKDHQKVGLL